MRDFYEQHIKPAISDIKSMLLRDTQRIRSSVVLIFIAGTLIELTSVVQSYYASKSIRKMVQHNAETELKVKSLEIQKVMTAVESAADNSVWVVEQWLRHPDSLTVSMRRMVKNNKTIVGAGLLFKEYYYPERGKWFEPYVVEHKDGTLEEKQIGSAEHDYFHAKWWNKAINSKEGYWSDPYFDNAGANMMLCTYFVPVHDSRGRTVAVLGADVSLDWLSSIVNAKHIYPSSFNVMISSTGQLIVCPVESLILRRNIQDVTSRLEDTTANYINSQMMAGKSGHADLIDEHGEKNYIFYAPVEGETGWSMAVVCSDRDVYGNLRMVNFNLMMMMLCGLCLMGYILWRSIRNARRLEEAQSQQATIENELHIASAIQMAMIPKVFPPFPDRKDVDIYALLTPAREVGGDLYDYFIRDEKLFFCIGDVSGKGVPASLVMSVTRTLFRNVAVHESQPHRILSALNDTGTDGDNDDLFVTCFVGVLDLPTGRLRYSNAGHDAPILITDTINYLPCDSNIPLGCMTGWNYTQQEITLDEKTMLFLYTDGLTEAMNADQTLFGKKRLNAALKKTDTPKALVEHITGAVQDFVDGAEQSDDLTMLAIRYTHLKRKPTFTRSLTLPNDVQTTPQLAAFVEDICHTLGFNVSQTMQMNLAIEEAVVNVMNYAYPQGTTGDINIEAAANENRLRFIISDSGMPFDPTAQPEVDTSLSAEERPIGGLGIHLVRHYMDSINYERVDNRNILTLRKLFKNG